jgi:DNA-directed RNA polymerase subunit beta'
VGRLIPAGTGLAYHAERKRRRREEDLASGRVEMATEDLEEALKKALNTSELG